LNWLEISLSDSDFFVFEAETLGKRRFFAALGPFQELSNSAASKTGPLVFLRGFGQGQSLNIFKPTRFEELEGGGEQDLTLKFSHRTNNFERFAAKFAQIQAAIERGQLKKAVPVEVFEGSLNQSRGRQQVVNLLMHSARHQSSGFFYAYVWRGSVCVGRSPELLFSGHQDGDQFKGQSMALAGTFDSSIDRSVALASAKEALEHQFVVNDVTNTLELLGAKVTVGERDVLIGPRLAHLKTPIEFRGRFGFSELIEALHPTAALGVVPKTQETLLMLDDVLRAPLPKHSLFAAPLGFVDEKGTTWCLAGIRNLEIDGDRARVCVGAGITRESVLENEWAELKLKVSSTLNALGVIETP
jgi:menaquinone-specific isochorismate synthase